MPQPKEVPQTVGFANEIIGCQGLWLDWESLTAALPVLATLSLTDEHDARLTVDDNSLATDAENRAAESFLNTLGRDPLEVNGSPVGKSREIEGSAGRNSDGVDGDGGAS